MNTSSFCSLLPHPGNWFPFVCSTWSLHVIHPRTRFTSIWHMSSGLKLSLNRQFLPAYKLLSFVHFDSGLLRNNLIFPRYKWTGWFKKHMSEPQRLCRMVLSSAQVPKKAASLHVLWTMELNHSTITLQNLSCLSDYFKATGSCRHLPLRPSESDTFVKTWILGKSIEFLGILIEPPSRRSRSCCCSQGPLVEWPQAGSACW